MPIVPATIAQPVNPGGGFDYVAVDGERRRVYAAHSGGIVGGFLLAYVAGTPGYSRTMEQVWRGLAIAAMAITVFAFVKWFLWLMANMDAIANIR